jgi:stage III sporulation protein AD
MNEAIRLVGIAIVLTVAVVFLRQHYRPVAVQLSMAFLVLIFIFMIPYLAEIIRFVQELGRRGGIKQLYLDILLKCLGVAYIASVGAQLAQDAGEQNIAMAIEFAGKILILVIALPMFSGVLASLLNIFP